MKDKSKALQKKHRTLTSRILTNPKSKSKSRLMTGFPLKSDFPTTLSQPARKVSKKQDTAIYPKQKWLVYIRRL